MAPVLSLAGYGKTAKVVEAGQVISGKYKLLRLLGDGGMGSVYEAEHLNLGTRVAIKVLHSDLARRSGIAERFLQEARVSAQIRSPHVCLVTDVDRTPDGVAYLVMELLQGEPLSNVIRRERRLPVPTASEYTLQILQALEAAHALGVIHRDLKPDNVFVTFQGGKPILKLIDFGIAKLKRAEGTKNLTVAGMLMGTPEYMAPEQAYSADKVDVRADIYAVGVMCYEMLSGSAPVSGDDPRVLVLKVERGEVTPLVHAAPGIRPELAGFVHRAMAPRPEVRFASATEMRLALEAIVSGKRVATAQIAGPSVSVSANPHAETAPAPHNAPQNPPHAEIGTGTVMGAPVDAALASPPPGMPGSGPPPPMPGGTVGAAPLDPGYGRPPPQPSMGSPSPMMGPPMHAPAYSPPPSYQATHPPKKSGSGLIIGLAAIALLLGAGAVVAYVASRDDNAPVPPPIVTTTTPPPATTTVTPPPATTTVTPAVTLTNTTPTPPPTNPNPNPPPVVKKDAGAPQPQPHVDSGAPPPADAGAPQQHVIVTPFGSFPYPGPRPPLYPADQPWPPPWMPPPPPQ